VLMARSRDSVATTVSKSGWENRLTSAP
jgi:hypothetical protein